MDASHAGRVVALTNQIQTIQQVLEIIDAGGTITAMTLQAPTPEPEPIPVPQPVEPPEAEEEPSDEPATPTTPDIEPAEPQAVDPPVLTVTTEGLVSPPQMMQVIRQQELEMWQTAYDALAELGVTDVPPPPTAGPPAATPAAAPTPPREPPPREPPPREPSHRRRK